MHEVWPAPGALLVSRYRLVTLLETGGMAQVWRATDELLDRPVAVKLPAGDIRAAHLAWREARLAARLSHPGIAAVHDYREAVRPDGSVVPFVVMELLAGETVAARLCDGPVPWPAAAAVGAAVAGALAAAHAAGVVHRDIKPGNVMLCEGGVKLLDFGISATAGEPDDDDTGATFGTPAYAAPERLDGKPAEPATDLYGLGVLLFEMVAGEPPYSVDTWEELAIARQAGPARLPEALPEPLVDLIHRCLDDDPERRPSAAEAWKVLAELAPSQDKRSPTVPLPGARPAGHARVPTVGLHGRVARGRKIAVGAALGATAVAFLALVHVVSQSGEDLAEPPAPSPPSVAPSTVTTTTPAPRKTTTSPSPEATTLTVDAALDRVTAAVEQGERSGAIRPDVAQDFRNILGQLATEDDPDIQEKVTLLRKKVRQRLGEGALTAAQAAVLQDRLTDLGQAGA
ncbi:serine/threonine-protein kinase [Actinoplanes oblitus]|uniref:non-specific serine/threonine protein kinase n=1 Tax=Actinoplanes oblitus TaxID=3040509 RepID=A0ABY8WDY4_9ACTN|nr:serine/threonine-protein kinase [Actinoplanes oblitus]WIM93930.1 serine/threonine-protein kinase [Actinoplanes oblitus]